MNPESSKQKSGSNEIDEWKIDSAVDVPHSS